MTLRPSALLPLVAAALLAACAADQAEEATALAAVTHPAGDSATLAAGSTVAGADPVADSAAGEAARDGEALAAGGGDPSAAPRGAVVDDSVV
ncbi:MAG TPA: hypothetical protein VFX39_08655, partial [Gemmatimonadaceae bacterium]|nr:hypothetical protein [Gemmatimonadaceae bacterium]